MAEILEYVERANKKLSDFNRQASSEKELQKRVKELRRQVNEGVKVFSRHGLVESNNEK